MANSQKFLTIAEAADLLQVSQTSLRRWTNSGKLRCFRVGGRRERRFLLDDLLAFMQSTETASIISTQLPSDGADYHEYHDRHICLFFRGFDDQWQQMRPYLQSYLNSKAPVLYIQDSTPPERLKRLLREDGLDVENLIDAELLRILSPDQAYLLTGQFEAQRMLAFMESAILSALAVGHKQVLLTGEMTWSLAGVPGSEQMMTYEALLNPIVEKYPEVTIICQYDLNRFNAATVLDALLTHPSAHLTDGLVSGFYSS